MQWVLNALFRYRNFLLFLLLLGFGLIFSGFQSSYHRSTLAKGSLFFTGLIHQPFNLLSTYLNLAEENKHLVLENNKLKNLVLERFKQSEILALEEETVVDPRYWSVPAKVIRNSFTRKRNIIIIDKGSNDNIVKDMGVIGTSGIIGIVNQISLGYASVLSILNQDVKINAKFKNSSVFGSLSWTSGMPNEMWLEDISIINPVQIGDTIVTGGMSTYFPEGIPIGKVSEIEQPESGGYYKIMVTLINNMTDIDYVYLVGNKNKEELLQLIDQP